MLIAFFSRPYINLGNCTIAVYCLYILVEALLLRRDFKPQMLLQLVASFLFGQLVNLATAMLSFLPSPGNYVLQMLYLLCSVPLVAAGVMLYLSPNILPTPGEGIPVRLCDCTGIVLVWSFPFALLKKPNADAAAFIRHP